jgi:hypothetical protein
MGAFVPSTVTASGQCAIPPGNRNHASPNTRTFNSNTACAASAFSEQPSHQIGSTREASLYGDSPDGLPPKTQPFQSRNTAGTSAPGDPSAAAQTPESTQAKHKVRQAPHRAIRIQPITNNISYRMRFNLNRFPNREELKKTFTALSDSMFPPNAKRAPG